MLIMLYVDGPVGREREQGDSEEAKEFWSLDGSLWPLSESLSHIVYGIHYRK